MAKSDIEVRVKNEYIQRVEGKPGDLFVMKLQNPMSIDRHKRLHAVVESELVRQYPGSRLIILPYEVASIRHLSDDDLNEAGYFKKGR